MIKKEPYDSPKFNVLNLGLKENVNTTINDVITTSDPDVWEEDPFDI